MKPFLIVVCVYLSIMHCYSQTSIEDSGIIENLTANEDIIESNSEAAENLAILTKNPFDINKADESIL